MTVRGDDNDNCFMDTAWYYSGYCYPASFSITAQIDLNKKALILEYGICFLTFIHESLRRKNRKDQKS